MTPGILWVGALGQDSAVIPFECQNISTCLDGYENPPTFSQCVALGPSTDDAIELDFNETQPGVEKVKVRVLTVSGTQVFYIGIEGVFLWTRKARQFLNACGKFMANRSERPKTADAMDMLCDVYQDAEGKNLCRELANNPLCIMDTTKTLHESLELALHSDPDCSSCQEMRGKLCECSCWSDIVKVYSPMMQQWSKYDAEISNKLSDLQTMCTRDVRIEVVHSIAESSSTQCGVNTITVSLTPSKSLPAGTVITVQGLNGDPRPARFLPDQSSASVGGMTWTPAVCAQWCSKAGFCPASGNARGDSCLARPTQASGTLTTQRCMRWCDKDAQLTVTLDETFSQPYPICADTRALAACVNENSAAEGITSSGCYQRVKKYADLIPQCRNIEQKEDFTAACKADVGFGSNAGEFSCQPPLVFAVELLNPTFKQSPNPLTLSITGHGVYLPATIMDSAVGVLSAQTPPTFSFSQTSSSNFTVGERGCDGVFDANSNLWRGSCAGMLNTVTITLRPNLEISPGATLEISGLVRSGGMAWDPPTIQTGSRTESPTYTENDGTMLLSDLVIDDWESSSGTLTLRMLDGSIMAGQSAILALEFPMPSIVDDDDVVKPPIKISVSRAGTNKDCEFMEQEGTVNTESGKVLVAKRPSTKSFKSRSVSSSTCYPGECNEVTVTILSNVVLRSNETNDITISITGIHGMNQSDACNPRSSCTVAAPNDVQLFDAEQGSNHRNLFLSLASTAAMATWDADGSRLIMRLAEGFQMDAYKEYAIRFRLENGFREVDLSTSIKIAGMMSNGDCLAGLSLSDAVGTATEGTCDQTAETMTQSVGVRVCAPAFVIRRVGQTFPWPGCDGRQNNVTVTLKPNVEIGPGSLISIKNFLGPEDLNVSCPEIATFNVTQNTSNGTNVTYYNQTIQRYCVTPAVVMQMSQSHNASFAWNNSASQIDLTLQRAMLPGQEYYFTFTFTNPVTTQTAPAMTVEASTQAFDIAADMLVHDDTTIPIANRSLAGDAAALRVLEPQFLVKVIGQSTPYPDAVNTITATLVPNVPLGAGTNITISGLTNANTLDSDGLAITQISPAARILGHNGSWTQNDGKLVFSLLNGTNWDVDDAEIILSFVVVNPGTCQSSPAVIVSAQVANTDCQVDIVATDMVKDDTTEHYV